MITTILLSADNLSPGTKIMLRPSVVKQISNAHNIAENQTTENSTAEREPQTHEVQPKESLYAISKKYGVSVSELKEWNNLKDNNLKVGQQLIVSK